MPIGELPEAGGWVRIEVDAAAVGLTPGSQVDGFAFGQHDGRVWWDESGLVTADAGVHAGVSAEVAEALRAESTGPLPAVAVQWHREHTPLLAEARAKIVELEASRPMVATTMVLQQVEQERVTRVLGKGSHLSPEEEVQPGVPAVLDPKRRARTSDRKEFAEWLVSPRHPLTARVTANRLWAWTFGDGLVPTLDDFGTQGARPSHPELLDWLAVEFVERGWSVKDYYRMLLTSSAYRQSSTRPVNAELDPENRWLSWFPRRRLDGEEIRDQALSVAGTLNRSIGGPSVYPPQPAGIDFATYASDRWRTSSGDEALRRGLYTFWRRTSPYPSLLIFDATSRELSCARRDRSNTPLQALVLLNDPNYAAAAAAFASEIETNGLDWAFRACTGRRPSVDEAWVLQELAKKDGWTSVAQVLLNLDETVTRG